MSGIQSHSDAIAGDTFVIFSPDSETEFALFLISYRYIHGVPLPHKLVRGCYKGQEEPAVIIINAKDWPACCVLTVGQESILVLGPIAYAGGERPATLHFLDGIRLPVSLGYFVPVPAETARKADAWTLDNGQHFICRHHRRSEAIPRA